MKPQRQELRYPGAYVTGAVRTPGKQNQKWTNPWCYSFSSQGLHSVLHPQNLHLQFLKAFVFTKHRCVSLALMVTKSIKQKISMHFLRLLICSKFQWCSMPLLERNQVGKLHSHWNNNKNLADHPRYVEVVKVYNFI